MGLLRLVFSGSLPSAKTGLKAIFYRLKDNYTQQEQIPMKYVIFFCC